MKLNYDCVRDVLLYLEENLLLGQKIQFNSETNNELNSKYSNDDIVYNSLKLLDAGFIDGKSYSSTQSYGPVVVEINSVTYQGHLFLDNIRDNNVWNKTKNIAKPFASMSLTLLSDIASKVINNLIFGNLNNQ